MGVSNTSPSIEKLILKLNKIRDSKVKHRSVKQSIGNGKQKSVTQNKRGANHPKKSVTQKKRKVSRPNEEPTKNITD